MAISSYLKKMRAKVGDDLLILPSVTIANFDKSGRLLLMKTTDTNVWVAPGGSIEPNETPADAAVREMWEETGLYVELTRIVGVYGGPDFQITYPNGDQTTYVMIVFESTTRRGELRAVDGEASNLAYFSRDELANLELATWAKIVVPRLFERQGLTDFEGSTWRP